MWIFGHPERNMDQLTDRVTQFTECPEHLGDSFSGSGVRWQ